MHHANMEDRQSLADYCVSTISNISHTCHSHLYVVIIWVCYLHGKHFLLPVMYYHQSRAD